MIPAATPRTCYRCGAEFQQYNGERLCPGCRKPRKRQGKPSVGTPLTLRQKQVIDLVALGKLNKEIAFDLHLTEGTIKEYLNRIFHKLDVKNRTELAIWSIRQTSQ